MTSGVRRGLVAVGVALGVGVVGCSGAAPGGPEPTAEPSAPPPAPPAACLLDPTGLATVTTLSWIPDQSTASDTRCVYDAAPVQPAGEPAPFLAVEITPAGAADPATELDGVAAACADGSRAPLQADANGFVCRFRGGSVFAAVIRNGQLVTVSASGVPSGTTAARLVLALQQQLDALGR